MSDAPTKDPKPEPPRYTRKYGKTVGTRQFDTVTYRGRLMKLATARRMYERDLAAWEIANG